MTEESDPLEPDSEPPHKKQKRKFPIFSFFLAFFLIAGVVGVSAYGSETASAKPPLQIAPLLLLIILGWFGSAVATILEHALFALDAEEVDNLDLRRPDEGKILIQLRQQLEQSWFSLLAAMLFSNLIFAFSLSAMAQVLFPATNLIGKVGIWLISALFVFLLGQVLPAVLSARKLKDMVPVAVHLIRFVVWVMKPLYILPLLVVRRRGRSAAARLDERRRILETEKRLLVLVGVGQVEVEFEEEEREMIDHAIGFGENTAGDIMTLRSEIGAIEENLSQEEVLEFMRLTRHSRIVVYKNTLDNVKGILHARQVLLNPNVDYRQFIVPALFVPEDMPLVELIALMKTERRQLVVVLDEYGSTAGVISMNDLLKELVGGKTEEEPAVAPLPEVRERSLV